MLRIWLTDGRVMDVEDPPTLRELSNLAFNPHDDLDATDLFVRMDEVWYNIANIVSIREL